MHVVPIHLIDTGPSPSKDPNHRIDSHLEPAKIIDIPNPHNGIDTKTLYQRPKSSKRTKVSQRMHDAQQQYKRPQLVIRIIIHVFTNIII